MVTRNDVITHAINECIKELYTMSQPQVSWKDLKEQCEVYSKAYLEWEEYKRAERDNKPLYEEYNERLNWNGKSITECIGPRPYEFYYIPDRVQKEIIDSYIYAYKLDNQQELLNTIEILKRYCEDPIIDKWIDDWDDEYGNHHPGYKGYDHPDNLEKEVFSILKDNSNFWKNAIGETNPKDLSKEICNKFFKFLDMAGDFYNWNGELNTFNINVYLGITPSTNKEKVIDNWKKYRNKDIEIDESKYKEELEWEN